jgi:succinoglycan biosynthesis protein ExoA
MSSRVGVGPVRFRLGVREPCRVDTVQFPVYRRAAFERVGVFDEELVRNQDDELNLRLRRAGGSILMLPDADVVYFCRPTLRALWRQYREYGFWKVRVMQKHGGPSSWRHLVPGGLVTLLAVTPPALLVPGLRVVVSAAVGAYAALVSGASLVLALRTSPTLWPRIAAALVTLHVAYGVGFWEGLFAFGVPRPGRATASRVGPGIIRAGT